ncbi:amino acid adenylation domain-containing protein [Streptomyces sp. S186]|uniref:amino acid adenylation domain-containing protein n=1 Tax=Streptomyces sp. S186 TaxID=3434395 RepID=UPI003F67CA40
MTSVQQLIDRIEMRGVDLWLEDGKLRFKAPTGAFGPELREQVAARRDEVIAVLAAREAVVRDPDNADRPFPLTDVQAAYLVGRTDAYAEGGVGCHGYAEFLLPDDLAGPAGRLRQAWQRVVDCHEMLRVTVSPDGWQRIDPGMDVPLLVHDCPTPEAFDETRRAVRSQLQHRSYELGGGPMIDAVVTRGPDESVLHLSVDLLLTDFRGLEVILEDFEMALDAPATPLTKPSLTFRDYILTMGRRAGTARARADRARDEEYWQERSEQLQPAMRFPPSLRAPGRNQDRGRGPVRYTRRSHLVEPERWAALTAAARSRGVTPSALLLAVLGRMARRYTDADRSLVTATVLDRSPVTEDVDRIVGDFTSTALTEAPGQPGVPFVDLARLAQDSLFEALDHGAVSGVEVGRMLARRPEGRSSTPQVVLTSTVGAGTGPGTGTGIGRRLRPVVAAGLSQTPQVLLDVQAAPHGGGASLVWDSRDGGIEESVLDAAFEDFVGAVELLAADESAWDRDLLDRRALPAVTRVPRRPRGTLQTRIREHAQAAPDAVAVVHSGTGTTVSRGELAERASAVTRTLAGAGVRPGSPVVVALPPGPDQIAAEIGVLAAGCYFVPVDPEWPAARREHIIATLSDSGADAGVFVIDPDTVLLPAGDPNIPDIPDVPDIPAVDPGQLAYVIFTSGSTGAPKGVALTHDQVATTLDAMEELLQLTADDAVLAVSRPSFDLSVFNVFGVLAAGGRVVLPSSGVTADPQTWVRAVAEHGVTVWNSVPEQLQLLLDHLDDEGAPAGRLSGLRAVLVSGDWVPVRQPGHLWRHAPDARFLALGGATEASIWSNLHEVTEALPPDARSVPYGTALPNQGIWVLNADGEPAVPGQPGEIHIGGDGVGAGYLGTGTGTGASAGTGSAASAAFYRHPDNGERCYRTGDRGRLLPNGEIEFLGRLDGQVKIRGHRIELAEVESALCAAEGIAAAVATTADTGRGKTLVAGVVPRRGPDRRAEGVRHAERVEQAVAAEHAAFIAELDADAFTEFLARMNAVALDAMGSKVAEECARGTTGVEDLVAALGGSGHRPLVRRWIRTLQDEGRLTVSGGNITVAPEPHEETALLQRWSEARELGRALDYGDEQLAYVERCLAELPALLSGEADPLALLFPEGSTHVARAAYAENLTSRYLNGLICAGIRERAEQRNAAGQPLRILEIGAGVGGTTAPVLAALEGCRAAYTFTDVSRFFLDEAAQRWPEVNVALFDLNEDPQEQGMAPGAFDVVLCANVLHNARDIPAALDRLHGLLAPGGTLAVIDSTKVNAPLLVSMEFKEGLTGFTDERAATGDAFFSLEQWNAALEASPFERCVHFPAEDSVLRPAAQSVFFAAARLDEELLTPLGAEHRPVARIWREVLGLDPDHPIAAGDNFFELGGDSLLIARCVGTLRREIPGAAAIPWDRLLREIVADPTVTGCVRALSDGGTADPSAPETGTETGTETEKGTADGKRPAEAQRPLVQLLDGRGSRWQRDAVVLVHDGSGGLGPYRDLLARLETRTERPAVFGVRRTPGDGGVDVAPEELFGTLAERYVRALDDSGPDRTDGPDRTHGRIHLVGYCMGGLIAASMAERLAERGTPPGSLTVVSSYRIPFVIEDGLLLDYSFARLMYRDPADAGLDFDEHELGDLLNEARARYGNRVPQGALAQLAVDYPRLGPAIATAPDSVRARLDRLAASDPAGAWTPASGAVGRACVRTLLGRQGAHVVAAGRHLPRLEEELRAYGAVSPDTVRVDLDESGSVDAALAGPAGPVDVVVNCAGPSYRYSASTAETALRHGARYVDAGGDQALIGETAAAAERHGALAVFGAGVQPGLAGVAVRAVAARLADPATTEIDAHCGGVQPLSRAGLDEYLHAVRARTGHPGKIYQRGALHTLPPDTGVAVPEAFPDTAAFPGSPRAHVSLDEECRAAAEELGLAALRWCNVTGSAPIEQALSRALGQERTHTETLRAIDAAVSGARPYFRISLQGTSGHGTSGHGTAGQTTVRTTLHCADSYALTGAVAALAALEDPRGRTGAVWMSEYVDARRFWDRMATDVPGVSLVLDTAPAAGLPGPWPSEPAEKPGQFEEGEL